MKRDLLIFLFCLCGFLYSCNTPQNVEEPDQLKPSDSAAVVDTTTIIL